MTNRAQWVAGLKRPLAIAGIALLLLANYALAQNLGAAPQTNVAVQGQTGAQPEGAFLNFVNWVGNVIAPVGAGGAVVGAIVSWLTGRGFGRWLFAAGALLAVSGVTRLIEFWIRNGTGESPNATRVPNFNPAARIGRRCIRAACAPAARRRTSTSRTKPTTT